jgi:signal transduction histidine kinase
MKIVQDTVSTYYPVFSKNNNRIYMSDIPDLPPVLCDSFRITQVLVNLITNAARHTRDGRIDISAKDEGEFVHITVSDTGEGIDTDRLPTIFDRYESGAAKGQGGTGLGLFISRFIIEAHGGTIGIESEPGKGTAVSFSLRVQKMS